MVEGRAHFALKHTEEQDLVASGAALKRAELGGLGEEDGHPSGRI